MKEFQIRSHFDELLRIAVEKEKEHGGKIGVATHPPLMPRSDSMEEVFAEGELFSGITSNETAQACLTIASSPHVDATLDKDSLTISSRKILGKNVELPRALEASINISPQLIVWWRSKTLPDEEMDILNIASLPETDRSLFAEIISLQTGNALQILDEISGKPTIWGSWGHATPKERAVEGKSRGLPTNRMGHCHVTYFDCENQNISIAKNIPTSERLNHYVPWNELLHVRLSQPISKFLQSQINAHPERECKIKLVSESRINPNGSSIENYGYNIIFQNPIKLNEVFSTLIDIAGESNDLYQELNMLYSEWYRHISISSERKQVEEKILYTMKDRGFNEMESLDIKNFLLAIQPTYGQLLRWENQTSGENKRRIIARIKRYEKAQGITYEGNLRTALISDSLAQPDNYRVIQRTWPVHATFSYIIDDYTLSEGNVYVNNILLLPSIASTEAGPEHIVGAILKRSQGNAR